MRLEQLLNTFPYIANLSMFYFHLDSKTLIMLIQTSKYFNNIRHSLYKLIIQHIWWTLSTPKSNMFIYMYNIKNVINNNNYLKNNKSLCKKVTQNWFKY
jgi:hypothetical protein